LLVSDIDFIRAKEEVQYLKETIKIHKRNDLRSVWNILKQVEGDG